MVNTHNVPSQQKRRLNVLWRCTYRSHELSPRRWRPQASKAKQSREHAHPKTETRTLVRLGALPRNHCFTVQHTVECGPEGMKVPAAALYSRELGQQLGHDETKPATLHIYVHLEPIAVKTRLSEPGPQLN